MDQRRLMYSSIATNNPLMSAGSQTLAPSQVSQPRRRFHQKYRTEQSLDLGQMDSLQRFQEELDSALQMKHNNYRIRKTGGHSRATNELRKEVEEIKQLLDKDHQMKGVENKLERMLLGLQDRSMNTLPVHANSIPQSPMYAYSQPPPYFMPYPMYPPEDRPHRHYRHKSKKLRIEDQLSDCDDSIEENSIRKYPSKKKSPYNSNPVFSRQRARNRLRRAFFVVAYTIFIKSQTKKLSSTRKSNLRKFWHDKFESQMNNVKNWLLNAFKYSLSIILEKGNLNFKFFHEKSQKVRLEKEKLLMQVLNIGLTKLLAQCSPQKVSLFSQLLYSFCFRGSFPVGKFWTAFEMEQLCISEYYGFIRADVNLEKFLIGVMIFIKVFTYNMLLQPHKFDEKNFPKRSEPLTSNMRVLGSIFYYMAKEVVEQYRTQIRDSEVFKPGNWLAVSKEFIAECSEPLTINNGYPQEGEYISGLFSEEEIGSIKELNTWDDCRDKVRQIIEKLQQEMHVKARLMRKNLKYKLYH